MNELISVVVPVFRTESFLDRCIGSIANQTYENLEILLVDDGSPDRCPQICDAWAEKDGRVRVIHQENAGGGEARNRALDLAQGAFIAFVDSDDYISPDMISFLYSQFLPETDIVECGFCSVNDDSAVFDSVDSAYEKKDFGTEDAMREHIRDRCFRQLIWNKLYRKRVIGDVRFPAGTKIDDEFWTYRVLGNAAHLVYTDKKLYAYRQQENSVMHLLSEEKRLQAIEAKTRRHEYIREKLPSLEQESLISLWFTFLYQGQLALRIEDQAERLRVWACITETARRYPPGDAFSAVPGRNRLWLTAASRFFLFVCWCRNFLKIGL